jgi:TPR repeat protein
MTTIPPRGAASASADQILRRPIADRRPRVLWSLAAALGVGLLWLGMGRQVAPVGPPLLPAQLDDKVRQGREAYDRGDFTSALAAWRKAAEAGSVQAQNALGFAFQTGRGAPQDYVEALKWYSMAADQGDAAGLASVGWLYEKGWGVAQDDGEALRRYNAAAEKGYAPAMTNLASLYEKGKGTPRDFVAALEWYQEAWEHGADKWAAYRLGQFYENGWGVEKDEAVANFWNALASGPSAMCG